MPNSNIKTTLTRFLLALSFILAYKPVSAQLSVGGTEVFSIATGEIFFVDGLAFTPGSTFDLSGTSITAQSSLTNTSMNTAIAKSFLFTPAAPSFSGVLQFYYSDDILNGIAENELELNYFNSNWQAVATSSRNTTLNFLVTGTVSILPAEITLASSLYPLPVQWLAIRASLKNQSAEVVWETASEDQVDYYEVQHSTDGGNWLSLGHVNPKGNLQNNYFMLHTQPKAGSNLYRIREVSQSGSSSYSKIVTIWVPSASQQMMLYPNPAHRQTVTLFLNSPATVSIYQANGTLISRRKYTAGMHSLDASGLQAGIYLIGNGIQLIRWVVQ